MSVGDIARTSLLANKAKNELIDGARSKKLVAQAQKGGGDDSNEINSPLDNIQLKSSRKSRMEKLVALEGKQRQQERMLHLMQARKAEFECLPVAERKALREAFTGCDTDCSGTLSFKELRRSLAELGVVGRNPEEKKQVTKICKEAACLDGINFFDFCFDIV